MNYTPIAAVTIDAQTRKTIYPAPYADLVAGRIKRRLGDHFGLSHYGVNLTQLQPGALSALLHKHSVQDELIYIVTGTPVLIIDKAEYLLKAGDCCGFKGGNGKAHHLANRSDSVVTYLEVGDRSPGDEVEYPDDDLMFAKTPDGQHYVAHKDGTPY
jgi:uncharacterized cupin superfamily protein